MEAKSDGKLWTNIFIPAYAHVYYISGLGSSELVFPWTEMLSLLELYFQFSVYDGIIEY